MKRKRLEKLVQVKTKKQGLVAAVQSMDDILVLDVYENGKYLGRYCMDTATGEYECRTAEGKWKRQKLVTLCGYEPYYSTYSLQSDMRFNSKAEKETVSKLLKCRDGKCEGDVIWTLCYNEKQYSREKRERAEDNRRERVNRVMCSIPRLPADFHEWIDKTAAGGEEYAFYDKAEKKWQCTGCGEKWEEKELYRTDGGNKIRHNDMVYCPSCKKIIQVKKRKQSLTRNTHCMLLQPVNDRYSVARHFDVCILWEAGEKVIKWNESIRFTLFKLANEPDKTCDIYYNQYSSSGAFGEGKWDSGYAAFDNKGNPANRRTFSCYLYPEGIRQALQDTVYESWAALFGQMAAAGKLVNYNRLMATQRADEFRGVVEYLFKGHFDRMLYETAEAVSYYFSEYHGTLHIPVKRKTTIEEVFGIKDRQKINRIRELDGGMDTLEWMRWSENTGQKIPQETLNWLTQSGVERDAVEFITDRMSITQVMNYVKRQQVESYKGKTAKQVLSQWEDYLSMCTRLKKHTEDEMVYRPRELKRRHDEAVAELELRQAQLQADEYRRRFPGAEEILAEIKEKYEYANEEYMIIVPGRLVDIVAEGRLLHHCAGATDRYFDRIKQRETYICFLRKKAEPDIPYYTIEVEPGGTIRQHRGYLDEEPEIEKVKPFLREWQQVIRKRLSEEDHRYAAVSKIKREQNIEELKARNNTRVLEGLMQDFMEAI